MNEEGRGQRLPGEKYIVLETYRKNGEGVRTPVWFVENNGMIYVRTGRKTGKMKRLRNNGRLRLAASTANGKPKGLWLEAEHTSAGQEELQKIIGQMGKKYGLQWKLVGLLHRLQGHPKYVFLAIRPLE